jgi:hypothetical protein
VDPTTCRHGVWPSSSLVTGRFAGLLERYTLALEVLALRLQQEEEAAARGRGRSQQPAASSGPLSAVESRLGDSGRLADETVRELRRTRDTHGRAFEGLVRKLEADLGMREPLKGPREPSGRLKILTSGSRGAT